MLTIYEIVALLLALSALFGWINLRFLRLPHTIGLLVMALAASLLLIIVDNAAPGLGFAAGLTDAIEGIDFSDTIMDGMLAFLLFAGALHVDFARLRSQKWAIAMMATVGVVISTVVVGFGLWGASLLLGFGLPLQWALVFGALISPTDPVAVLGLLKTVDVPDTIKARIAGESLFNDGVAVVAFAVLLAVAIGTTGGSQAQLDAWRVLELLFYEAGGAGVFGLFTGWVGLRMIAGVEDRTVAILISLAACVMTYVLCIRLEMSGPIAVVVTGLTIANSGAGAAMSGKMRASLFTFWEVIDELLNSVLFLLIGLEVVVIRFDPSLLWIVAAAIPVVLAARLVSVTVPMALLSIRRSLDHGSVPILTWGGLRGGVSVALALSLPDSEAKALLLSATYAVVIFSIVVQGLTVKWVIERSVLPREAGLRN